MGAFEYTALDASGRNKHGVLEGDTARQIRQKLRDQGLTPLDVEEVERQIKSKRNWQFNLKNIGNSISSMDLALITRQLATLLRSGLPIEEALRSVGKQSGKPRVERIILAVRSRVREGHSLASGLSEFPNTFPELYCKTVEAGEQTGHMDIILERLADYTESHQQMKQKTVLALFYPALLTIMSILIISVLLAYVVPQVTSMFDNLNQELPWITQALIATSDTLRDYGIYMLLAILGLVAVFSNMMKRPAFKMMVHKIILKTPLLGRLSRGANAARFSQTLSILIASSVPILEALRISSQVITSLPMRTSVEKATIAVREGSGIHHALEKTGFFPPMTLSLIASGEASGDLQGMLERSAAIQEREIDALISTLLGLFEPILIMVMGGVVLIIVLAILLPIFQINQLIA